MNGVNLNSSTLVNVNLTGNVNGAGRTQVDVGVLSSTQSTTGFSNNDGLDIGGGSTLSQTGGCAMASETVVNVNITFTAAQQKQLNDVRSDVKAGNLSSAADKFSAFVKDIHANGMPVDVNALVQEVLRESYLDTTEDLKFYADKVKYFNEAKKMTREYVQDLRDFKTGLSKAAQNFSCSYVDKDGNQQTINGFCLSDPPTDDPAKSYFNEFVHQYCADNVKVAKHATGDVSVKYGPVNAAIDELSFSLGVTGVISRANDMINDTFGCSVPDQIKDKLESAYLNHDDAKLSDAMRDLAGYVSYLGDAAVAGGRFGKANSGIDDVRHKPGCGEPCYEDYQYYLNDPSNASARSDLSWSGGDQAQIMKAFGFDSSVNLTTYTKFEDVVNTALSPLHNAWENKIKTAVDSSTAEIADDLKKNGANSVWCQQYPDIFNNSIINNAENNQMANDLGLPSTVPGTDVTTVEDLDNAIKKFEEKLSSIGDDAQLANTDLQNILQKQQQTLQMMSNISKTLSDTALAVIRKIG